METIGANQELSDAMAMPLAETQPPTLQARRRNGGKTIGEMLQGSLLGRPDLQVAVDAALASQRLGRLGIDNA